MSPKKNKDKEHELEHRHKAVQEDEIDLMALFQRLWNKRRFIFKVTGIVLVIGLLTAAFSPVKYTAQSVFVPQTSPLAAGSNLQGLASLVGVSLNNSDQTSAVLSPMVYPNILNNVNFEKRLIYAKYKFDDITDSVSYFDYYYNPKYMKRNVLRTIKKYTIGLPGIIMGAKKTKISAGNSSLITLTEDEAKCIKRLNADLSLDIDSKNGYLTLTATMPTAITAAQLAANAQNLLQQYITDFKIQKTQEQLQYIDQRYEEARRDYIAKQQAYAQFQDANRMLSSALAQTRGQRLQDEYNLAYSLYNQLSTQKMQAELQVKENTPIFTVIQPVTVPNEKSEPKRIKTMMIALFLGLILGAGLVLGLDYLKENLGSSSLNKWH